MATPRERAQELLDQFTTARALQIADTMLCTSIGSKKPIAEDYWRDVIDQIEDIDLRTNTYSGMD